MSIEKVEALFEKALLLVQKANQQLSAEFSSPNLLQTVFLALLDCERQKENLK